jgi:hypothetical protein
MKKLIINKTTQTKEIIEDIRGRETGVVYIEIDLLI